MTKVIWSCNVRGVVIVFTVKGNVNKFVRAITLLAARSAAKSSLFVPLKIVAKDGKLSTSSAAQGKTAFVLGMVSGFDTVGEGVILLDKDGPDRLLSILGLFPAEEVVSFEVDESLLTIRGAKDEVKYRMVDEDIVKDYFFNPLPFPIKDGVALFKGQKPTTHAKVPAVELSKLVDRSSVSGVDYYRFIFKKDGSKVRMGDLSVAASTPVETELAASIEGDDCETVLGGQFNNIISVIDGEWDLWSMNSAPIWMSRKCEEYSIAYYIAPRVEG